VIVLLLGVLLDLALNDGVGGVVAANMLKVRVFRAHGIVSELGESAIHHDRAVSMGDLQNILHFLVLLLSGLAGQQFFAVMMALKDLREDFKEPPLHFLIGLCLQHLRLILIGGCGHPLEDLHRGLALIIMLDDVGSHELVGQSLENGLARLRRLASDHHDLVVGEVEARLTEHRVFIRAVAGSFLVELLGNCEGMGAITNLDFGHGNPSFRALGPVVYF